MGQQARKDPRAKVLSMTVRYRSATLGEFIEHHSYDVSRGGMFIKTSSPFPSGTLLKFEVRIAEEQRVLQGVGRVVWKREADGATEDEPAGMGIKFIKIDDASRDVIERLVETRGESESAFDRAPASARMFPDGAPAAQPAPEDRTVMKPAKELFADALRMAGEEAGAGAEAGGGKGERASASGFEPARAPSRPFPTPSHGEGGAAAGRGSQPRESSHGEPGSEAARRASGVEHRSTAAQPSTREDEGGVGRTVLLLVVAAIAAAGVFYLTKLGQGTPPEPPPVDPAPQPVPVLPAPVMPEEPVEETTGVELSADGDDSAVGPLAPSELDDATEPSSAPSASAAKASAAPAVESKPQAVKKPKVVNTPRPVAPSATPSAVASSAPAAAPAAAAPTTSADTPPASAVPAPVEPSPAASAP